MYGKIIRFFKKTRTKNGYGFIQGSDDVTYYFSVKDCLNRDQLEVGQNVEFYVGVNAKGRTAKMVKIP